MTLLKTTFAGELLAVVILLAQHKYLTLFFLLIVLLLSLWHLREGRQREREEL